MSKAKLAQLRQIIVLLLFFTGLILSLLSLAADYIGLDLTPGFGMVQMFQLLIGLTLLTLAGFLYLHSLRPAGAPRSLQADIGIRLAATGLVFAYITGLADLFGIGTHVQPGFDRPHVGPLQLGGLLLSLLAILVGMYLYHTSRGARQISSMEFIVNGNGERQRESVS